MENPTASNPTPWKNGYYISKNLQHILYSVEGEDVTMEALSGRPTNVDPTMKGTWKYGDFGEAPADVVNATGKGNYNVEMSLWGGMLKILAALSDDGTTLTSMSMVQKGTDTYAWQSDEEISALKETGDPCDALPCHYKIQPENQGKLVWITGAPGVGKSTSGQILAKKSGYVYYEADAYMGHVNPYNPLEGDNPSLDTIKQKFLKGIPQERIDAVGDCTKDFHAMVKGEPYDADKVARLHALMCKDIARERKRIGGDFVITHAVTSRAFRDRVRTELGPDLIFVVLHMTKEDQLARINARHGDGEGAQPFIDMLAKLYDLYEPAETDEPNTFGLLVKNDMSRDDVVEQILQGLKKY